MGRERLVTHSSHCLCCVCCIGIHPASLSAHSSLHFTTAPRDSAHVLAATVDWLTPTDWTYHPALHRFIGLAFRHTAPLLLLLLRHRPADHLPSSLPATVPRLVSSHHSLLFSSLLAHLFPVPSLLFSSARLSSVHSVQRPARCRTRHAHPRRYRGARQANTSRDKHQRPA